VRAIAEWNERISRHDARLERLASGSQRLHELASRPVSRAPSQELYAVEGLADSATPPPAAAAADDEPHELTATMRTPCRHTHGSTPGSLSRTPAHDCDCDRTADF
jgi:hypothetical protein